MRAIAIFTLFILFQTASAQQEESYSLKNEDYRLVNATSMNFQVCAQQDAQKQLAEQADVRNIAAVAISNCDGELNELRTELGAKMPERSYQGLERSIKNRTIKKLLLQLMYQKSANEEEEP